jgi:ArsR family transcriptional regulator
MRREVLRSEGQTDRYLELVLSEDADERSHEAAMMGDADGSTGVLADGDACCSPVAGVELTEDQAARFAGYLKAIADPSRLRLISVIAARPAGAACECELTEPLGLSQPTISYHLTKLLRAGLIERVAAPAGGDVPTTAKCVYYRVVPEALSAVARALTVTAP